MRLLSVLIALIAGGAAEVGHALRVGSPTHEGSSHSFVGRRGDTFTVPAAATSCVVSSEAGATNVICQHVPDGRYSAVFFRDNLLVYRNGMPDRPVFSARGRP